jgi:hypothetical protein
MPYEISWRVEKRIINIRIFGEFTLEQLHAYDKELTGYLDTCTVPLVHAIYDLTQSTRLPALRHIAVLPSGRHPRLGWTVVVGDMNPLARTIVTMAAAIFRLRFRILARMSDVSPFLYRMDPTLPAPEQTI